MLPYVLMQVVQHNIHIIKHKQHRVQILDIITELHIHIVIKQVHIHVQSALMVVILVIIGMSVIVLTNI